VKTQIINLEEHDDLISIRDKMGWGKTGRILLVWPKEGNVPLNRLEITLLQRHSQTLGAQLGFITRNGEIRAHANELGIPTYKNLHQAQQAIWRTPRRVRRAQTHRAIQLRQGREGIPRIDLRAEKPPATSLDLPRGVSWAIFSLGVLAVILLGAVVVPAAEIRLQPEERDQQLEFTVRADPQARTVNLAGTLPAEPIRVVVEGRDQLIVSGSASLPYQSAGGLVTFTNLSDREIQIPNGSVVSTTGQPAIRFTTTRAGVAAPGPGATVNLPVRALQAGEAGNISAGEIKAIEGPLGIELTATNPRPFSGGSDITSLAPSARDYDRLSTRLHEALRQTALGELRASLEPGDLLIEDTLELSRTPEEVFQPASIQPANELTLHLRLEFSARVARNSDLVNLAESVLNARLPAGFRPLAGSLLLTPLEAPEIAPNGRAQWSMLALRRIQAEISPAEAFQMALGLEPQAARQKLAQTLPLGELPEIIMIPRWWPRLPLLPFRISLADAP
jgi:hypothetical protein